MLAIHGVIQAAATQRRFVFDFLHPRLDGLCSSGAFRGSGRCRQVAGAGTDRLGAGWLIGMLSGVEVLLSVWGVQPQDHLKVCPEHKPQLRCETSTVWLKAHVVH